MGLTLPRGGVPLGFEVARALNLPWDIFIVRKLGVPGREELAMGTTAPGSVRLWNDGPAAEASMRVVDSPAAERCAPDQVGCCGCCQLHLCRRESRQRSLSFAPVDLYAVGRWYRCFWQTTGQEVRDVSEERPEPSVAGTGGPTIRLRATEAPLTGSQFYQEHSANAPVRSGIQAVRGGIYYPLNRCCAYARTESACSGTFCFFAVCL